MTTWRFFATNEDLGDDQTALGLGLFAPTAKSELGHLSYGIVTAFHNDDHAVIFGLITPRQSHNLVLNDRRPYVSLFCLRGEIWREA